MTVRRVVLVVLAAMLGVLAVTGPAGAALVTHARLLATTPADGDTVDTVAEVTLTFSEDVSAQFVRVRVDGPGGDEADGTPTVDGREVTQVLPPDLPAGEHRVTYRVVSVDGHPVSGSFSFTTTEGPAPATPTGPPTSSPSSEAPSPPPASPTPTADASPTAAPAEGTPGWVVAALGVLVVAPVLAGAVLLLRRREGTPNDPSR